MPTGAEVCTEPSIELRRGFFGSERGTDWSTFGVGCDNGDAECRFFAYYADVTWSQYQMMFSDEHEYATNRGSQKPTSSRLKRVRCSIG